MNNQPFQQTAYIAMQQRRERRTHLTEIVLESASVQREARLSEVSMGGCFIDTIVETHVGESVSFQIIGKDPPLRFTGVVIYTFPGIGIRIIVYRPSGIEPGISKVYPGRNRVLLDGRQLAAFEKRHVLGPGVVPQAPT